MKFSTRVSKHKAASLIGAGVLVLGGITSATVAGAGAADAAACVPGTFVTSCTLAGTAGITGVLSMAMPTDTLTWNGIVDGTDAPDTATDDLGFSVADETQTTTATGWNVNATFDGFTNVDTGATATGMNLYVNGSDSSFTGAVPDFTLTCNGGTPGTFCSDPATTLTTADFPAQIGATAKAIYNAGAGSGQGTMDVGQVTPAEVTAGKAPVAWWVLAPTGTPAGVYSTTVTVAVTSGPTAP